MAGMSWAGPKLLRLQEKGGIRAFADEGGGADLGGGDTSGGDKSGGGLGDPEGAADVAGKSGGTTGGTPGEGLSEAERAALGDVAPGTAPGESAPGLSFGGTSPQSTMMDPAYNNVLTGVTPAKTSGWDLVGALKGLGLGALQGSLFGGVPGAIAGAVKGGIQGSYDPSRAGFVDTSRSLADLAEASRSTGPSGGGRASPGEGPSRGGGPSLGREGMGGDPAEYFQQMVLSGLGADSGAFGGVNLSALSPADRAALLAGQTPPGWRAMLTDVGPRTPGAFGADVGPLPTGGLTDQFRDLLLRAGLEKYRDPRTPLDFNDIFRVTRLTQDDILRLALGNEGIR